MDRSVILFKIYLKLKLRGCLSIKFRSFKRNFDSHKYRVDVRYKDDHYKFAYHYPQLKRDIDTITGREIDLISLKPSNYYCKEGDIEITKHELTTLVKNQK